MCGIAGIYNLSQAKKIDVELLAKFNRSLYERGPDSTGTLIKADFGLTHRRLVIIDPVNGQQPFEYAGHYLVYNGELYNYLELNKKLASIGVTVETASDTETLIKYLVHFGYDKLADLDGMFAFALVTPDRILLSRDHVGKKPLFYTINKGQLFFASSLKALLAVDRFSIDNTALINNLMYGNQTFDNRSIYKNILAVPTATQITFQSGSDRPVKEFRYWQLDISRKYYNLSLNSAKEMLEEKLSAAVKKRLISDVPLGAYLSGGLDSTIIVSLMKKYQEDLITYSICYDDQVTQENSHAMLAAKRLGTKHRSIEPELSTFLKDQDFLLNQKMMPLSTMNEIPIYLLAKEAAKELTVVLSGEGADELFGGYGMISRAPVDFMRSLFKRSLSRPFDFDSALMRLYGRTDFPSVLSHFQLFFRRMQNFDLLQIISPDINTNLAIEEIDEYFSSCFERYQEHNLYTQYSAVVFDHNLRSLLERLDFNTMQASIEARAPFLDKAVIDFAFNIPWDYKLHIKKFPGCLCHANATEIAAQYDTTKYILREAYQGKIPAEILTRPKQSFPVPLKEVYLPSAVDDLKHRLLNNPSGFFNKTLLPEWLNDFCGPESALKYWSLDNLEKFFRL